MMGVPGIFRSGIVLGVLVFHGGVVPLVGLVFVVAVVVVVISFVGPCA